MATDKSLLGDMSDEEIDGLFRDIAESFKAEIIALNEHHEKIEKCADEMSNKELYEHINSIINEYGGVFWDYKDDYFLEQVVEHKFMKLLENTMELENSNLESCIDFEKMTEEQSEKYMFANSPLYPFTIDDKHFVAYHVYGQGESFLKLKEVEKESAKYITKYIDMNFNEDSST